MKMQNGWFKNINLHKHDRNIVKHNYQNSNTLSIISLSYAYYFLFYFAYYTACVVVFMNVFMQSDNSMSSLSSGFSRGNIITIKSIVNISNFKMLFLWIDSNIKICECFSFFLLRRYVWLNLYVFVINHQQTFYRKQILWWKYFV